MVSHICQGLFTTIPQISSSSYQSYMIRISSIYHVGNLDTVVDVSGTSSSSCFASGVKASIVISTVYPE